MRDGCASPRKRKDPRLQSENPLAKSLVTQPQTKDTKFLRLRPIFNRPRVLQGQRNGLCQLRIRCIFMWTDRDTRLFRPLFLSGQPFLQVQRGQIVLESPRLKFSPVCLFLGQHPSQSRLSTSYSSPLRIWTAWFCCLHGEII